jgi:hypothetical protein
MHKPLSGDAKSKLRLSALVGVLGVVYGDIGTSPLYALQASLGYFQKSGLKYFRYLIPDLLGADHRGDPQICHLHHARG